MHPSGFEPRAQVEHDVHPTGATAPACEAVESGLRRRWGEWRVTHALLLLGDGFSDSEQSLYTAAIGQEAEVAQARHKATAHMTRQRAHRKQNRCCEQGSIDPMAPRRLRAPGNAGARDDSDSAPRCATPRSCPTARSSASHRRRTRASSTTRIQTAARTPRADAPPPSH